MKKAHFSQLFLKIANFEGKHLLASIVKIGLKNKLVKTVKFGLDAEVRDELNILNK